MGKAGSEVERSWDAKKLTVKSSGKVGKIKCIDGKFYAAKLLSANAVTGKGVCVFPKDTQPKKKFPCQLADFLHLEGRKAVSMNVTFRKPHEISPVLHDRNVKLVELMRERFPVDAPVHVLVIDGSNMNTARAIKAVFPSSRVVGVNRDAATVMAMLQTPQLYADAAQMDLGKPRKTFMYKAPQGQVEDLERDTGFSFDVVCFDGCGALDDKVLKFPASSGQLGKGRLLMVTVCKRGSKVSHSEAVDAFVPRGYEFVAPGATKTGSMSVRFFRTPNVEAAGGGGFLARVTTLEECIYGNRDDASAASVDPGLVERVGKLEQIMFGAAREAALPTRSFAQRLAALEQL